MLPARRFISPFDPCPAIAEWRVFPMNDHYEISEHGHVRRAVGGSNSKKGKVLRPTPGRYVKYTLSRDSVETSMHAHRLVAITFIGPPSAERNQVAHRDGIEDNCHYKNLRWSTPVENAADKHAHGTTVRGIYVNTAKLTPLDVVAIRASGSSQTALAEIYGVSQAAISCIQLRKTWKHIQ